MISLVGGTLDVVDDTHQDDFTELSILGSRTHGVAERALDHREDGLRQGSLAVESLIDPRVMRVIDGTELTMLDQRSHAFFPQFLT